MTSSVGPGAHWRRDGPREHYFINFGTLVKGVLHTFLGTPLAAGARLWPFACGRDVVSSRG